MKFCNSCGGPLEWRVPEGESSPRHVCQNCNSVHYLNPKLIVGCLPVWEDRVLLCKRAIEPRQGFWTLPGGFMEIGETVEEGALRETREEANARVRIRRLHSVYSIPHIGQIHMFFLCDLEDTNFHPGAESLDVKLFAESEIPWADIAFSSIRHALESYFAHPRDAGGEPYFSAYIPAGA